MFSRREMIKGIGKAICAGLTVPFLPKLLPEQRCKITSGMELFGQGSFSVGAWFDTKTLKELKIPGNTYTLHHALGEFEITRPCVADEDPEKDLKDFVWV